MHKTVHAHTARNYTSMNNLKLHLQMYGKTVIKRINNYQMLLKDTRYYGFLTISIIYYTRTTILVNIAIFRPIHIPYLFSYMYDKF